MNADPIAKAYRWFEYLRFGKSLERCRCSLLNHLQRPRAVCVLGDGDGRFTQCLLRSWPAATVDFVELSGGMIDQARLRLSNENGNRRVRFHCADALRWASQAQASFDGDSFDLVATHFFFDVLTDQQARQLIGNLSPRLTPGAHWLISEFNLPPGPLGALWARCWIAVMYRFFRFTTGLQTTRIPDWRAALSRYGFRPVRQLRFKRGFLVAELWQLPAKAGNTA